MSDHRADQAGLHAFAPDAGRAQFLDARMHDELGRSLAHLAEVLSESHPGAAGSLAAAAGLLSAGQRVGPEAFGRYFQIGERVLAGALEGIGTEAGALADAVARGRAPFAVVPRGGAGELDALIGQRMGGEAAAFAPVTAEAAEDLARRLDEGLALLAAALPELHAEITAITRLVMAATSPEGATFTFDGASHYQFWGLLLLNPAFHTTRLAMAEVLAHETAHSLLFGLTVDEPLVLNPDEARYPSPLRADPRPMDGIYHATFVSARMAWAMEALAGSDLLRPEEKAEALKAAAADRANFAAGLSVVEAHGDLSPTGRAIMEGARAWIGA